MAAKSDLGQKLLHDLRLRKERMAAAQNSSLNSSQSARANVHGNSGQTNRGARQINGSASSRTENSSRSSGRSESSNQIVLYNKGNQSSRQISDLSMAIALAFENGGKLSKAGTPSSNPLVNFFNRFTRGWMDGARTNIVSFNKNGYSMDQFPAISHIQIIEIEKGVRQLNEILQAFPNRNSIEVGKELLKGAIHLEESLRMLANMQQETAYNNGRKSRIRLLEEDEDEQDDTDKTVKNQMQVTRPRFSFDKPSTNSYVAQRSNGDTPKRGELALLCLNETFKEKASNLKTVPPKGSATCVAELGSHSTQGKRRISNVVAKLMGLEELPLKEDCKDVKTKFSSNGKERKEGKVPSEDSRFHEKLNGDDKKGSLSSDRNIKRSSHTTTNRKTNFDRKGEKIQEDEVGNFKITNSERNQLLRVDAVSSPKLGIAKMNKEQNQIILPNQVAGFQNLKDRERKQSSSEDGERKIPETKERKSKTLNNVHQQKVQENSVTSEAEDMTNENFEFKVSIDHIKKKDVDKYLLTKQKSPTDKYPPIQMQVFKEPKHSEDKDWALQKRMPFLKQNTTAKKNEGHQESATSSKTKQNGEMRQKKLHDKGTDRNVKPVTFAENSSMKDPPKNKYKESAPIIDVYNGPASQKGVERELESQNAAPEELKVDRLKASDCAPLLREENPKDISETRKADSKMVQMSENPRKIEVSMTKQNRTLNQLRKRLRESANRIQDRKLQIQTKNNGSKELDQQSDGQAKEVKVAIIMHSSSDMQIEPSAKPENFQNELEPTTRLNISVDNECQTQITQDTLTLDDNGGGDIGSKSGDISNGLQKMQHIDAFEDKKVPKQHNERGGHNESMVSDALCEHNHKQYHALRRQEPLTENEKNLKEMVIKSQMFLNTAEALFKLNIPISFLHAGDHSDEAPVKKLVLDCGCEVMKRKARRYQVAYHPYMKTTLSCTTIVSLDDLVRQLCKDFKMLNFYGEGETKVADQLHKMMDKDIHNDNSDVNSMWDFEWNKMMFTCPETEDIIRYVEKLVLNGLLNELTNDLLLTTAFV